MYFFEVVLISAALSVDNMAVAAASSVSSKNNRKILMFKEMAAFSLMGLLFLSVGWVGGKGLYNYIHSWDHWLSFILLAYIGGKMIKNSFACAAQAQSGCVIYNFSSLKTLLFLAFATNLDVLAVGISLSFSKAKLWLVMLVLLFFISSATALGVAAGRRFGDKFGSRAEALGGIVLVFIGLKILFGGF